MHYGCFCLAIMRMCRNDSHDHDETLTSRKSGILTGFDVINRQHKNTPQEEFLPRKNVKTHENELYGDAACTTETNRHDIKIQTKLHLI